MKKSKKLSLSERQFLYKLQELGYGIRETAKKMRRSPSTVSRELRRNRVGMNWYCCTSVEKAALAHMATVKRRHKPRKRLKLKSMKIREYATKKLEAGWTPELISGRIRLDLPGYSISHEALYQWIYKEARELIKFLPYAGKKRRNCRSKKRKLRKVKRKTPKRSVSDRAETINTRTDFGHWEGDTVGSTRAGKSCVQSLRERKTRKVFFRKIAACTAEESYYAKVAVLGSVPALARKSITEDNGPENESYEKLERRLKLLVYFCHPYSAWERGSVENAHLPLRRVFPKGTNFDNINAAQLQKVEDAINDRPMKCLDFKTPNEAFAEEINALKQAA